ncbi:MAG: class I SAM-dependent methyltransferase [bacterium]
MVRLSHRLALVAQLAEAGRRLADIGTDHGLVPAFFALRGGCERIVATDLRPGPLDAARETARACGVAEKIEFVLTDGLAGLDAGLDTLILAGMGGDLMARILTDAPWSLRGPTLVLQPQTHADKLLPLLAAHGLGCTGAGLAEDGGKLYAAFRFAPGAPAQPLTGAAAFGLDFLKNDPLFPRCRAALLRKLEASRAGLSRAERRDEARIAALEALMEEVKYASCG